MTLAVMNGITISLIYLIVISMVLPTSAIMYASGQSTDNSDDSSTGGSSTDNSGSSTTDNSGSSTTGGGTTTTDNSGSSSLVVETTTDNSGSSSTGGGTTTTPDNSGSSSTGGSTTDNSGSSTPSTTTTTTDNSGSSTPSTTTTPDSSGSSTSGSTDNSATLPTTSTASNNTGKLTELDVNAILAVHNRERAAVGVAPLVWSDKLAADAQVWADHMATTGQVAHDTEHLATLGEGENIAGYFHGECTWHLPSRADMVCTHSPIGESPENWVTEKPKYHGEIMTADNYLVFGHYTQMVWKNTKEVGCGFAGSSLVCRYSPPGNFMGQAPY